MILFLLFQMMCRSLVNQNLGLDLNQPRLLLPTNTVSYLKLILQMYLQQVFQPLDIYKLLIFIYFIS